MGEPKRSQVFFPHANGELRWWDTVFSPIIDRAGKPERILAVSRDMTELRRASAEQEKARELAEEANRAKSLFLANVSHELRTPLNGVLGVTELLLRSGLSQEQQESAETVKQSGAALLALVSDLPDLSRVEAGKLDCKRAAFDLKRTVNQAVALIAPAVNLKGLELTVDLPAWLHLFTPFRQADASSTRKHGGMGLGLALSKRIAELMGGSVGLMSTPGEGSAFWVRLPLLLTDKCSLDDRFENTAAAKLTALPEAPRVLVAEDNSINQKVVLQFLKRLGCTPDIAPDGVAALHLFKQNRYDLVLMDCQMPELDGYQATEGIRELESCRRQKRTPVIALTAHAMVGDRERCLRSGMDDYIAKPLRLEHLKEVLAKWTLSAGGTREVA